MITKEQMTQYYNQIAQKLTNYLVANGESYESACDIVQETFIRIWQKRDEYSPEDSISGIAYQTARNLRIDAFRKNKPMQVTDEFDHIEDDNSPLNKPYEGDIAYLRKKLIAALEKIPEDLRTCYTLSKVAGLSGEEISEKLGINKGLVKVRVHRAKEMLAELLKDVKEEFLG
jgi:RNA polymerase sigma-70 factor (ECF subfamily)